MNEVDYRAAARRLYSEYIKQLAADGGQLPSALPHIHRPLYEEFRILANLTGSDEEFLQDIEECVKAIRARRADVLRYLEESCPEEDADPPLPPKRLDGKAKSLEAVIENAKESLLAYQQRHNSKISIASQLYEFDTACDKESRNAERKTRVRIAHASSLLKAISDSPQAFYAALAEPLPKK